MIRSIVLIHSPLVGPTSWRPTARALERRGYACAVPSVPGASVPSWHDWAETMSSVIDPNERAVLVGHSAAGLLLPAIARRVHARALAFVDARIPPDAGAVRPSDQEFLSFVATRADDDGMLPPWLRWWGDRAAEGIIPDPDVRADFEADAPRLALSWFDDAASVPPWTDLPAAFVQLSEAYAAEAADAAGRGWPVERIDGTHVSTLTDPDAVAAAIASVLARLALPSN